MTQCKCGKVWMLPQLTIGPEGIRATTGAKTTQSFTLNVGLGWAKHTATECEGYVVLR